VHASLDVDDEDKPHVSFKSNPHPPKMHHESSNVELDFNILPAKAQYLILNDLIHGQSEDMVVFTTLPAPAPGIYQDEEKSVEYISGLELLCDHVVSTRCHSISEGVCGSSLEGGSHIFCMCLPSGDVAVFLKPPAHCRSLF